MAAPLVQRACTLLLVAVKTTLINLENCTNLESNYSRDACSYRAILADLPKKKHNILVLTNDPPLKAQ